MLHVLTLILIGIVCSEMGAWFERKKHKTEKKELSLPYSWNCPQPHCSVRISSSSESVLKKVSVNHASNHYKG